MRPSPLRGARVDSETLSPAKGAGAPGVTHDPGMWYLSFFNWLDDSSR